MAQAKQGDTVKVNYVGKLSDGKVFDSSKEHEPLKFTLGQRQVIAGFEEGVIGMALGETKTINVTPDKAYGPIRKELIDNIPKEWLPKGIHPEVGKRLRIQQPGQQPILMLITAETDTEITVDANHPLAGKDLIFEIELLEIL
jgi:FKBP-type peptidyl-prolyl cis-trans isomerase 2